MSFSTKQYHEKLYKTIEAINNAMYTGTFINNPGFGSIFSILKDPKYSKSIHNVLDKYYTEDHKLQIIKSLESASRTSYYTPIPIIAAINRSISNIEGFKPKSILEPSAGNGTWIKELQTLYPDAAYTAFEKDILTAQIFEHNHKYSDNVQLYGVPFEQSVHTDAPTSYDLVISNIPFAQSRVFDQTLAKVPNSRSIQSSLHSYFTYKANQMTKVDGISVILSTKSLMDSPKHETTRRAITDSSNFIGAVRLPKNTFEDENTPVVTDVMFFQKRENYNEVTATQEDLNTSFIFSETILLEGEEYPISSYYKDNPNNVIGKIQLVPSAHGKSVSVLSDLDNNGISLELEAISKNFSFKELNRIAQQDKKVTLEKTIEGDINNSNDEASKEEDKINTEEETTEDIAQAKPFSPEQEIANSDSYRVGPGSLIIHRQKVGQIQLDGSIDYINIKPNHYDPLSRIIHMRNQAFIMLNNPSKEAYDKAQDELNATYDMFSFSYGSLNEGYISHLMAADKDAPLISNFEILQNPKTNEYAKGTIFTAPFKGQQKSENTQIDTNISEQGVIDTSSQNEDEKTPIDENIDPLTLEDGVLLSLNKIGGIDTTFISKHTSLSEEEILQQGISKQLIFLEPEDDGTISLVSKQRFNSGYIYKKIDFYKEKDFSDYEQYITDEYKASIVQKLETIKPSVTKWEDLDVLLHENWFPTDIVKDFINETYSSVANIDYNETLSKYMVRMESTDYKKVGQFYVRSEHRSYNFGKILSAALNQTIPKITKGKKENKRIDKAKMTEIKVKMQMIYSDFSNYIHTHESLKKKLEKTFYQKYDAYVRPKYDGSYLTYNGLAKFTPHSYQNDTTAGIIQNEGLLVNMEVGFGKTLTMALSAMKMKEIGIAKKPLVIGLNSTVIQLGKSFKEAFPYMKIIVLTDKNAKGPKKREQAFNQIAKNNYDIVLMSHDAFAKIPQDPKVEMQIIEDTIDDLDRDLSVIYENKYDINARVLKGLETRKDNLSAKLQELSFKLNDRKDTSVNFSEMGIDHIMVDESHYFKNLAYTTRHNRVGGLNTPLGSQRSHNLLVAIRTLQSAKGKDFQATFLSGTPISNSVTEVYVLLKYLRPNKLKELNIQSFDQFAQMFAKKTYDFEPTLDGSFKIKERFRGWKKLRLLSLLINDLGIVVNNKTHGIERPELLPQVIEISPTKTQEQYFLDVAEYLNTKDSDLLLGDKEYDEKSSAASLIANHHLRTASIDPRLLDETLEDPGDNKLRVIASQVSEIYNDTMDFKGVQAIFSDIGTPKEMFNVYDELKRILIEEENLPEHVIQFKHHFDKNDELKQQFNNKANNGEFRVVIGSTQKMGTGTNIQKRLIGMHHVDIPYKSTDIDQRNGRGVRPGNSFAKSHYDNKVKSFFYITKKSVDAVLLNHVNTKKTFIDQITNGTIKYNSIDMGPVDESGNIDYKSMMAIANDNPLYMEKKDLAQEIEDLNLEKNIIIRNHNNAKSIISYQYDQLKSFDSLLQKLEKDISYYNSTNNETHYSDITVTGKTDKIYKEPKELGEVIQKISKERSSIEGTHQIASYKGATLFLNVSAFSTDKLSVTTETGIQYNYGSKEVVKNPETVGRYIQKSFAKIPNLINTYKELKVDAERVIEANQKILEVTFSKEDKLKDSVEKFLKIKEKLEKIEAEKEAEREKKNEEEKENPEKNNDSNVQIAPEEKPSENEDVEPNNDQENNDDQNEKNNNDNDEELEM